MTPPNDIPTKPTVLHLGDPIEFNHDLYRELQSRFSVGYDTLEEMLPHADCILMSAPTQSDDGRPILRREHFSMLKRGARVVNIGRGTLLDEEALADALDSGAVYSAGLDVHANEPHVSARLRAHRNVSLTSHTAGGALETTSGFEALSMQNVLAVLGGKAPLTPVNLHLFKKT
ncbi:hypothetical protein MAPG_11180 [Magnaporthiopsis poae ATCC 64411]|uniref:D-isomer specific 2-hydroxyacid dehydrogenase NAD-binding domain-containing protein n=1 Tax=Magnaporthiopsis poae (strain ATCC 64411 / 73-15) TaxID=644358 RepID=A0A0C4EEK6_MAGP6|nr:hypothetical protein MAPG_11180 [Magnaporthiopsis poae ATCC 64411]